MPNINYYKVLGIEPTDNNETIRAAYRKLAHRYHPDVNKDPRAKKRMQQINEAWENLENPTRRSEYDTKLNQIERLKIRGPRWGGVEPDINDLFNGMFGMEFNFLYGTRDLKAIYMSRTDAAFLNALTDSYSKPKDGTWTIKVTNADVQKGITDFMYQLHLLGDKVSITVGFEYKKDELNNVWKALDGLAYKIAMSKPGKKFDVGQEMGQINRYSLGLWDRGDKRIVKWPLDSFVNDIQATRGLIEFKSTYTSEGNRRNTER